MMEPVEETWSTKSANGPAYQPIDRAEGQRLMIMLSCATVLLGAGCGIFAFLWFKCRRQT